MTAKLLNIEDLKGIVKDDQVLKRDDQTIRSLVLTCAFYMVHADHHVAVNTARTIQLSMAHGIDPMGDPNNDNPGKGAGI